MGLRTIFKKIAGLTFASGCTYFYIRYLAWVYVVPCGLPSCVDYFFAGLGALGLFILWLLAIFC